METVKAHRNRLACHVSSRQTWPIAEPTSRTRTNSRGRPRGKGVTVAAYYNHEHPGTRLLRTTLSVGLHGRCRSSMFSLHNLQQTCLGGCRESIAHCHVRSAVTKSSHDNEPERMAAKLCSRPAVCGLVAFQHSPDERACRPQLAFATAGSPRRPALPWRARNLLLPVPTTAPTRT